MSASPTLLHFRDRGDAGRRLAALLARYRRDPAALVVGIARGGMIIAHEIAESLDLPLDVIVIRRLPVPEREELSMGSVGPAGVCVLNDEVIDELRIAPYEIDEAVERETMEVERLEHFYRDDRDALALEKRIVIIADDGLTTGSTLRTAIASVRRHKPRRIVLALPVGPASRLERLAHEADEIVCLVRADPLGTIGFWYDDFNPVYDQDVMAMLQHAAVSYAYV